MLSYFYFSLFFQLSQLSMHSTNSQGSTTFKVKRKTKIYIKQFFLSKSLFSEINSTSIFIYHVSQFSFRATFLKLQIHAKHVINVPRWCFARCSSRLVSRSSAKLVAGIKVTCCLPFREFICFRRSTVLDDGFHVVVRIAGHRSGLRGHTSNTNRERARLGHARRQGELSSAPPRIGPSSECHPLAFAACSRMHA